MVGWEDECTGLCAGERCMTMGVYEYGTRDKGNTVIRPLERLFVMFNH